MALTLPGDPCGPAFREALAWFGSRRDRSPPSHDDAVSSHAGLVRDLWNEVAGEPKERAPQQPVLVVSGASGELPSRLPVEEAAVACVGTALLAAARLGADGSGDREAPAVHVARGHVAAAVRSERYFRLGGRPAGPGFAALSRFWPTADGWLRTHANYPWHKAALVETLGTSDDPEEVGRAIRALPAGVVEERIFAAGGVAAAVREAAEWRAQPQGRAVADEAIVGHLSLGDAEPRVGTDGGHLPADGVRVLDFTRVIAGPVCTRFLGALGADVLRLDPPGHPDMRPGATADTLLAKRSAALDLTESGAVTVLHQLLHRADAVVCGYRPGSLQRFGLAPEALAERHPGLVVVYLDAWGHTGPWARRRGFDSVVQAATGIAVTESGGGAAPGALPCQLLDHGTGYLAAAAVLDGLRRQRAEGGTVVRQLSLARTAMWLLGARRSGHAQVDSEAGLPDATPWVEQLSAPAGAPVVQAIGPPGSLGDRVLRWPGPPARYLEDQPAWAGP